jgi:ADP-ribosylglycohydrolase
LIQIEHYRGSLLGLAVGDALGTTLEFTEPGTFTPIDDIVGDGPFNLLPGQWTDDTSLALCLAESLVECRGFDPHDQMERYLRWFREGYMSSTGECFDIGTTTSEALIRFERTGEPFSGLTSSGTAGNGSLMRLAPVPLFYAKTPQEAIRRAAESSKTTHGAFEAVDACRYLSALIIGALNGVEKHILLSDHYEPVPGIWREVLLTPRVANVASGSFKQFDPPVIRGTGHVVKSLEAALWAFDRANSFEDGLLRAVNLGEDADTTGAVYGQLAGAFYGERGIPKKWRSKVAYKDLIISLAERIYYLAFHE